MKCDEEDSLANTTSLRTNKLRQRSSVSSKRWVLRFPTSQLQDQLIYAEKIRPFISLPAPLKYRWVLSSDITPTSNDHEKPICEPKTRVKIEI
ncbi:hypothetical protein TNCV_4474711 [Trichonephila clavipes]|nr:hypothetical protein TNCV_4474711 [Trichonephila clavipes]